MKVIVKINQTVDLTKGAAETEVYECPYGSSLDGDEGGVSYTTCRGNAATVTADGTLVLEGTRGGVMSALGSLSSYVGVDLLTMFRGGQVVEYKTTCPTWKWYEDLSSAALRGDKTALREQGRRNAIEEWKGRNPLFKVSKDLGYKASGFIAESRNCAPGILARKMELISKEVKKLVLQYHAWEAAKPV